MLPYTFFLLLWKQGFSLFPVDSGIICGQKEMGIVLPPVRLLTRPFSRCCVVLRGDVPLL